MEGESWILNSENAANDSYSTAYFIFRLFKIHEISMQERIKEKRYFSIYKISNFQFIEVTDIDL